MWCWCFDPTLHTLFMSFLKGACVAEKQLFRNVSTILRVEQLRNQSEISMHTKSANIQKTWTLALFT